MDAEEVYVDDNAHTGCYIFRSTDNEQQDELDQRPKKRRKIGASSHDAVNKDEAFTWPRLLGGQESPEGPHLRQQLFEAVWAEQQAKIDAVTGRVDETFVDEMLEYMRNYEVEKSDGRIGTGLVVSTHGRDAYKDLFRGWENGHSPTSTDLLIRLQPSHAPSLQIALKNIIRFALSQRQGMDEYNTFLAANKGMIPMSFDLELLHRYSIKHDVNRVLVFVSDIEAFDTGVFSELVATFSSWTDRIPFVLFIEISTTIALFESRLSRSTINQLDARVFESLHADNQNDPLFEIYATIQDSGADVFIGPSTVGVLAELAQDQSCTTETLLRALKYVFMSHFFANPLSVLLRSNTDTVSPGVLSLAQILRNTPGFRAHCEHLANGTKAQRQRLRALLSSDATLETESIQCLRAGRERMRSMLTTVTSTRFVYQHLHGTTTMSSFEVQTELLASLPDLSQSEIFNDIETTIRSMGTFKDFQDFISAISEALEDLNAFEPDLEDYGTDQSIPTLSSIRDELQLDLRNRDLSELTNAFLNLLNCYIQSRTTYTHAGPEAIPWTTFMAEAYIYNLKSPLNAIVHPRTRYALERALTRPSDYLGCDCCMPDKGAVLDKTTLPPTCLLLSMLNEAGTVINVRDLWDAFRGVVAPSLGYSGTEQNGDKDSEGNEEGLEDMDEATERKALALFYRSVAELRHLGLIRQSKRKPGVDCVAKTAWMGL
ncbi:Origin recognition complex subunit 3 [Exophiala oligosperma]